MKLVGVLIGALLVAVAVVGCGGDDGGETSSVTKAEFVKQADAICKESGAKQKAAALALFKEQRERGQPSAQEIQEQTEEVVTEVILPGYEQMSDELAQLKVPADGGDRVDAIIEAYQGAIQKVESDLDSFLNDEADPFEQPRKLAVAYGAKACGQA